jgi:hypothetical protein
MMVKIENLRRKKQKNSASLISLQNHLKKRIQFLQYVIACIKGGKNTPKVAQLLG